MTESAGSGGMPLSCPTKGMETQKRLTLPTRSAVLPAQHLAGRQSSRPDRQCLTLQMLSDPTRDFQIWNERAGGLDAPKVAAIVMTMVGSKSQVKATPDQASRMYIERAIAIAVVLTDDFHSAGRISGAKRIPISELKVSSFDRVESRRLQVNESTIRYQKQLRYLASMI